LEADAVSSLKPETTYDGEGGHWGFYIESGVWHEVSLILRKIKAHIEQEKNAGKEEK